MRDSILVPLGENVVSGWSAVLDIAGGVVVVGDSSDVDSFEAFVFNHLPGDMPRLAHHIDVANPDDWAEQVRAEMNFRYESTQRREVPVVLVARLDSENIDRTDVRESLTFLTQIVRTGTHLGLHAVVFADTDSLSVESGLSVFARSCNSVIVLANEETPGTEWGELLGIAPPSPRKSQFDHLITRNPGCADSHVLFDVAGSPC